MAECLEFWPEYEGGPLWDDQGRSVDLGDRSLPADLRVRVAEWVAAYGDEKLPMDGPGDVEWLAVGTALLAELRVALSPVCTIVVTKPWWGEEPAG